MFECAAFCGRMSVGNTEPPGGVCAKIFYQIDSVCSTFLCVRFHFTMNPFYTTNIIESLNASYRRLNRQRSVFPSAQALLKVLYLTAFEATKKWTMPIKNWGKIRGELAIMYPNRLPD